MKAGIKNKILQPRIMAIVLISLILCVVAVVYGVLFAAITPRQRYVISAILRGESENFVLASDVRASRTNMIFSLYNSTDVDINYGAYWELARLRFGRWRPVSHIRGINRGIPDIAYIFQAGETRQYNITWDWLFGELQNGRYMFIRRYLNEYALIEFEIDASTNQQPLEDTFITPPPSTGSPAPMVHIDGRIYNRCPIHGAAPVRLDDSFTFIGEVTSYSWLFLDVTENLQSNSNHLLGARLYQSGEDLIVMLNNYYMLYRFTDSYIEGWQAASILP